MFDYVIRLVYSTKYPYLRSPVDGFQVLTVLSFESDVRLEQSRLYSTEFIWSLWFVRFLENDPELTF